MSFLVSFACHDWITVIDGRHLLNRTPRRGYRGRNPQSQGLNPMVVLNTLRGRTRGIGLRGSQPQLELGAGEGEPLAGARVHAGLSLKWYRCTTSSDHDTKAHHPSSAGEHGIYLFQNAEGIHNVHSSPAEP